MAPSAATSHRRYGRIRIAPLRPGSLDSSTVGRSRDPRLAVPGLGVAAAPGGAASAGGVSGGAASGGGGAGAAVSGGGWVSAVSGSGWVGTTLCSVDRVSSPAGGGPP